MQLKELKKKYNQYLNRSKNAEIWFKEHTVSECLEKLNLFNTVTKELSKTKKEIEDLLYRDMTEEEIWNGFKV